MKNDERLQAIKEEANAKAFGLCFIGLWVIIFYRQFILKQAPSEYRDIFFLVIGVSLYLVMTIVLKGGYTKKASSLQKQPALRLLINIVYLAIFTGFFAFTTGVRKPLDLLLASSIFAIISKSPILLTYFSQKIIDRDLEE